MTPDADRPELSTPRTAALWVTARPRAFPRWAAHDAYMHTVVADLARTPLANLRHVFAQIVGYDLRARLAAVTAPTLVVHGGAGPIVSFAQARLLAHRVTIAEFVRLDAVGHLPFGQAKDVFWHIINTWFDL